jgi:hypothetical protein
LSPNDRVEASGSEGFYSTGNDDWYGEFRKTVEGWDEESRQAKEQDDDWRLLVLPDGRGWDVEADEDFDRVVAARLIRY